MDRSSIEHGSPCLIPTHPDSQLASQSKDKVKEIVPVEVPVEGTKPASHRSSSRSLRTDDEGVSQSTFYTAQQSIASVTAESTSSNAQKDCTGAELICPKNTVLHVPVLSSIMELDSIVTTRRVREEVSLLIVLKDRLELIFGCSDIKNVLELQHSTPVSVDHDTDVTNAAVASIPFVNTSSNSPASGMSVVTVS